MSFAIKIDEDLPESLVTILSAEGYDTSSVLIQGWGGEEDEIIWPKIIKEHRFFITSDIGFGDIRKFPPGTHPGILVLRPYREGLLEIKALLKSVLKSHSLKKLTGCVTVATEGKIRIRRSS